MDEPRATHDVDVMVASRHHKRALKALLEAFPNLEPIDGDVLPGRGTTHLNPKRQRGTRRKSSLALRVKMARDHARVIVTQLRDRKTQAVLIDVIQPVQQPHREIFKHTKTVVFHGQTYRIPSLEMALVLKFAAMVSLNRPEEDKYQDAHDFIRMVKANTKINADSLAYLGDLVYSGGGKEVLDMMQRAHSREKLNL